MPFQVGPNCYASAVQAAQAQASSMAGSVIQGPSAHVVDVSAVSETSITYQFTPVGGGSPLTLVAPFTAQPCNLMTAEDGLSIGWSIAAIWLGVYALIFIGRAVRGWGTDDERDA